MTCSGVETPTVAILTELDVSYVPSTISFKTYWEVPVEGWK